MKSPTSPSLRSDLADRYLEPVKGLWRSPAQLSRVAHVLTSACKAAPVASALPAAINVDVSDACNIGCRVCSREIAWDRRDHPFIQPAHFEALVMEVQPAYLLLSGYGEPLLHKQLPQLVAFASRRGARVAVVTNGTLLEGQRARALRATGLARLKCSLDGADPEHFAWMRQGGDLERILSNLAAFAALPVPAGERPTVIEVQCVLSRDNLDQMAPLMDLCAARLPGVQPNFLGMFTYGRQPGFVERALPGQHEPGGAAVVARIQSGREHAARLGFRRSVGALDAILRGLSGEADRGACYMPWYQATVSTDGLVYPCCHHSVGGTAVGNAFELGFAAVWNGPEMQRFRRKLRVDRGADTVCASCRHDDAPMDRAFAAARSTGLLGRAP